MVTAIDFLTRAQSDQGGWGYRVGGMPFVEPTAAAILALASTPSIPASVLARSREFLLALQRADGGWGIGAIDNESGWMTAWAVFALATLGGAEQAVERGVGWLLGMEGIRTEDPATRARVRDLFAMDVSLRGWPWQPGDSAWVHPTALAVLALAAAGRAGESRVREGVTFLLDRAVASGGWNVGNPQMMGKELRATVQATAIALYALRAADAAQQDAQIDAGCRFLLQEVPNASSSELAWAILALNQWRVTVDQASARLAACQDKDGSWQANPFITAIAVLAGGT